MESPLAGTKKQQLKGLQNWLHFSDSEVWNLTYILNKVRAHGQDILQTKRQFILLYLDSHIDSVFEAHGGIYSTHRFQMDSPVTNYQ